MSNISHYETRLFKYFLYLLLLSMLPSLNMKASERKSLFDRNWYFYRGDVRNAESPVYNDSAWRKVDLPHDWSIEPLENQEPDKVVGPFSRESVGGFATGQTVGGKGWYRKTFIISPEDAGKRHELYFEGIYNQSEIWINGQKAYYNVYGYTSFKVDITPYCKPAGEKNIIAVKVINEGKNSRWYTGSGIYRHVWMIRTSPSYIEDWGTFISTNSIDKEQAVVILNTTIVNGDTEEGEYTVNINLTSPRGKVVSTTNSTVKMTSGNKHEIPFTITVKKPRLWSTDTPELYIANISLWKNKEKKDELSIPFGIRTIHFSTGKGFKLNGVPMKLKGGCVHHDNGLLGSAAFDRAEERKIQLLKQNGFNAVRTSHNPKVLCRLATD